MEQFAQNFVDFKIKSIGKLWGKYEGKEKGKESFEIDVVAVGEKKIALFEVKWSELDEKEVEREFEKLKEKAEAIKDSREKELIIVTRKVKKKRENVYDLEDIQNMAQKVK